MKPRTFEDHLPNGLEFAERMMRDAIRSLTKQMAANLVDAFGTCTTGHATGGTLKLDDLDEMMRRFGDRGREAIMPFGLPLHGLPIYEDYSLTEPYTEEVVYRGHPIVQWLARWLHFDPDVHQTIVRQRPSRKVLHVNGSLVMHPAMAVELRNATSA